MASLDLFIVNVATAPDRRARAVRIWAATGALASAAGPVLGGLLVAASWRWVFVINLPIGILTVVIAARIVPSVVSDRGGRVPDLVGAATLAVGIGALALGLVQGPEWGWASAGVVTAFVVAVGGLVVVVQRCRTHPVPVLQIALLRVRALAWSNVTSLVFSIAFAASLLTLVLWLQQVWGYSALRTGLAVAPGPLMVPIFAAVGQRLSRRVPVGVLAAAGCVLLGAGAVLVLLSVTTTPNYAAGVLPGWLVGAVGVGLALPTILGSATLDLPADRAATGSAVVNVGRQVGSVLGISMLVVLLGTPDAGSALPPFQRVWWATTGYAGLAGLAALGMTPRSSR
ncbi:MFS transporter [Dermatophilaceae bacterium Soc4.6]